MAVRIKNLTKDKMIKGFSKRLNFFLDKAQFAPIGAGRGREVADIVGATKSSGNNWVTQDLPPKRDTLKSIVKFIVKHKKLPFDAAKITAWLEHGDAVPNPFHDHQNSHLTDLEEKNDHVLKSKIYVAVHRLAEQIGLNIYDLNIKVMNRLYNQITEDTLQKHRDEPDEYFIRSCLELIQSCQAEAEE